MEGRDEVPLLAGFCRSEALKTRWHLLRCPAKRRQNRLGDRLVIEIDRGLGKAAIKQIVDATRLRSGVRNPHRPGWRTVKMRGHRLQERSWAATTLLSA